MKGPKPFAEWMSKTAAEQIPKIPVKQTKGRTEEEQRGREKFDIDITNREEVVDYLMTEKGMDPVEADSMYEDGGFTYQDFLKEKRGSVNGKAPEGVGKNYKKGYYGVGKQIIRDGTIINYEGKSALGRYSSETNPKGKTREVFDIPAFDQHTVYYGRGKNDKKPVGYSKSGDEYKKIKSRKGEAKTKDISEKKYTRKIKRKDKKFYK